MVEQDPDAAPRRVREKEVELLWGFQFVVAIGENHTGTYTLQHERCAAPAGEAEACYTFDLPLGEAACETLFAPKYGIDSSQYKVGDNSYTFTMRLMEGCTVVSDDSFTTVVTFDPQ